MPKVATRGAGAGRPAPDAAQEPRARLYWKDGRAYIDARAWATWGGKLEALVVPGERGATRDAVQGAILFAQRLAQLRALCAAHPAGLPQSAEESQSAVEESAEELDRIATFAGWYLAEKERRAGRKRVTRRHLDEQRRKLAHAARFFAKKRGKEHLRELEAADIREYMKELRTVLPPRKHRRVGGCRGDVLSSTTQRRYLDTLGELLQAAVAEGRISTNWVNERTDLPAVDPSPTKHLELWEAALLLEAARRLYPARRKSPPIYPLLAFYLLTGVIESEREGVTVPDVRFPGDPEFPKGAIIIRPNAAVRGEDTRDRLKTEYRERIIPLHPQLAEILGEYLSGPSAPPGPLLFPAYGSDGTVPVGDWRKQLDRIAVYCGYQPGEIRTRRLRVTYCSHRAYTVDEHGQPMTAVKLQAEMGHGSFQMIERRYFRHTRLRAARPHLEYRWSDWSGKYGDRLGQGARGIHEDLSPKLRAVLALLPSEGLSAKEWEVASGLPVGTFYYCRDVLVERGYVRRFGAGRGAPFRRVEELGEEAARSAA
jgi:integrase